MLIALLICCFLTWSPIFLYQIIYRPFLILLVWFFVAPVALNLISAPGTNPFFEPPRAVSKRAQKENKAYFTAPQQVNLSDLLEPTRVLFSIILIFFILNLLRRGRGEAPLDRTELWMCIFCCVLVMNVLLQSWRVTFGLRIASDAFIVPFLAYFFVRRLVISAYHFRQFTLILGGLGFYLLIIGLSEFFVYYLIANQPRRLHGPFFNHRDLFYIVMMTIFFIVLLDLINNRKSSNAKPALPSSIQWIVLSMTPFTILMTLTRGNWLGFALGVWVLFFLGRRLMNIHQKLRIIGSALLFVLVTIASILAFTPEFVQKTISDRSAQENTIDDRLMTWKVAMKEGFKHPIFGIGLNNMRNVLRLEKNDNLGTIHNGFLTFFIELGAVGLLAYIGIIVSISRMGLKLYRNGVHSQNRWQGIGVLAIMTAYLTPTLFSNILYTPSVAHVYVFASIGGIAGLHRSYRLTH